MFLLGAIMYGMRAVIMSVTFLPPSFYNRDTICMPQVNRSHMYGIEIATRYRIISLLHKLFRFAVTETVMFINLYSPPFAGLSLMW